MGHRNWLAAVRQGGLLYLACAAAWMLFLGTASPALAADSATDESVLVFDLASEDAVVEQHTAQLLWNLTTDNIVPERAAYLVGWNSLFLETPGTVTGRLTADLANGTIGGEFTEKWACANNCVTKDGTPSWTTTRDTGWTATITDGTVTADAGRWIVGGSVAIKYTSAVTANESPSECDGSPCYVCQQQLCRVGGEATATAKLTGSIEGDRLSLSFADKLAADITTMDFSGLTETEFFMSRFSLTMTGVAAATASGSPADDAVTDTPPPKKPTPSDSADLELPPGQLIPGVDAGSPPSGFSDDTEADRQDTAQADEDDGANSLAEGTDDSDKDSPIGTFILAIALLVGVATAMILVRQIMNSSRKQTPIERSAEARTEARTAQEKARAVSEWFNNEATHVVEPGQIVWVYNPVLTERAKATGQDLAGAEPLPASVQIMPHREDEAGPLLRAWVVDGVTVIHDPANPERAVLRTGAQIWVQPTQLTPLPSEQFTPTHELIGTKTIRGEGESQGYAYQPGTPVQVITTTGDKMLVRVDAKTRMWVPRSNVGPATAQIDPP